MVATPLHSTALRVTWEEPNFEDQNGVLQDYVITYSTVGNAIKMMMTVEITEVILSGLEEFTDYMLMVNASTLVGVGPGAVVTVRTLADGK